LTDARIVWGLCRRFPGALPSQVLAEDARVLRMLDVLRVAGELDPPEQPGGGEW
jgi:hypothetical protein